MRLAGFLMAVGQTRVINLAGGTSAWIDTGNPFETKTRTETSSVGITGGVPHGLEKLGLQARTVLPKDLTSE